MSILNKVLFCFSSRKEAVFVVSSLRRGTSSHISGTQKSFELSAFLKIFLWVVPLVQMTHRRTLESRTPLLHSQIREKRELDCKDWTQELRKISEIPEALEKDPVFNQFTCSITQRPVRHPILDPNGKTLYEKSVITHWLENNSFSPVTHKPLRVQELKSAAFIQCIIDTHLLRYIKEKPQLFSFSNKVR